MRNLQFLSWGQREKDSPATRLAKSNLILLNVSISLIALLFAIPTALAGAVTLSIVLFSAGAAHFINLAILGRSNRYDRYLRFSTAVALLFTIAVRVTMRGYPGADAMLIGGLVIPCSAALTGNRRATYFWCGVYVVILAAFAVSDTIWPPPAPQISPWLKATLGPLIAISGTIIVVLMVFGLARGRKELAADLEREHARSEALLLNVLPPSIAQRLKTTPGVIAERFDEATVLFADIVGFTELSANMDASALVVMLDRVFAEFDALVRQHGLEKIKTIGDAYMVAGGVPVPRDDHAAAVARMALDMLRAFERAAPGLRLRIGIHSGPVVAGVIGREKFIYDLWGDTVNTASRMESHGVPGAIQVTERVQSLLGDAFQFEQRGPIPVKGKGEMVCYLLRKESFA